MGKIRQTPQGELEDFYVRLPIGLKNQVKGIAALRGMELQNACAEAFREWIEKNSGKSV
jgi:hypothetical protein